MAENEKTPARKQPTALFSTIAFLAVIIEMLVMINLGASTEMAVFFACVIMVIVTFLLRIPWRETEAALLNTVKDAIPMFLIVIMVGMMVGIWMAGGTVPALMYYGLKLVSPSILVPLAFLLCALCSEFTGTSFGSVATMGTAIAGVASTTDIPLGLVVGAAACGAWFGDKMSPLSDTTNLASGVNRVPIYDHISSMMYTTIPAGIISLVLFTIAGLVMGGGNVDSEKANLIIDTLTANYNINIFLILPAILVLVVGILKIPAIVGMGITVLVSIVFAMVFQGVGFMDLLGYAVNGFSISTGVSIVDPMLNRGGIYSMKELLVVFMLSASLGGLFESTGVLSVLAKEVFGKVLKTRPITVIFSLIYCYIVNFLTGGAQTPAIILTTQTFEESYADRDIAAKVLSRTCEDAGTLTAPVVPWGVATLYVMSVTGCDLSYIKYCWFIFIVPVFSILCAVTGWGMWDREGKPLWSSKKKKA